MSVITRVNVWGIIINYNLIIIVTNGMIELKNESLDYDNEHD